MISCIPIVSVQRAGAPDAIAGHLSWGVLADRDRVLAPTPAPWLRDPTIPVEVLLASTPRKGPPLIERIKIASVEVWGRSPDAPGSVAGIVLAQRSEHRPYPGRVFDNSARVVASTEDDSDLWAAMERRDLVPPGLLKRPAQEALKGIVELERSRRLELVTDIPVLGFRQYMGFLCCLFRVCSRCCPPL